MTTRTEAPPGSAMLPRDTSRSTCPGSWKLPGRAGGGSQGFLGSRFRAIHLAGQCPPYHRTMRRIAFTVDSALLRELGERLVGRPHIALAELVKNSYDADATRAVIRFHGDRIEVEDNGHGMTLEEFRTGWMRVGTPIKQAQQLSRRFRRPLTGSKGVGRLSAQFLAGELEIRTAARSTTLSEIRARVDWRKAVKSGDLTRATMQFEERPPQSPFGPRRLGTLITLTDLNQQWDSKAFESLARELWALQPPFRLDTEQERAAIGAFEISIETPDDPEIAHRFSESMRQVLDLRSARLKGRLLRGASGASVQLALTFDDGEHLTQQYPATDLIDRLDFEIRVFDLQGRQPHGFRVADARAYLADFGGVHVYDAGFHMPYYGVDTDWLDIEKDHARRLSRSELLPEALQISEGETHLPTNRRLFGVVRVDTSHEAVATLPTARRDRLAIQVTRDRLVDNAAHGELKRVVRWALDYYAHQQARREFSRRVAPPPTRGPGASVARALDILQTHRTALPDSTFLELKEALVTTAQATLTEQGEVRRLTGLLGALATAGIAAVAYEHELTKQLRALERLCLEIRADRGVDLASLARDLEQWVTRARRTQALFSHLIDGEDRETVRVFRVLDIVNAAVEQTKLVFGPMEIDTSMTDPALRLPPGRLAEWSAILQNALFNAHDAMLATEDKRLRVRTNREGSRRGFVVEDSGIGVDLASAGSLFEPFEKRLQLPPDLRSLALGTSGLGLTIVRMICQDLGCQVGFVQPAPTYSTALLVSWRGR
jgi:hypothetical protein